MKKILLIGGIIVVLVIIGAAVSGSDPTSNNEESSNKSDSASDSQPTTAGIGQPARDGKFEPQSLFSDNQYLFNASGQKYSADSTATTYAAPEDSDTWYSEINPGNSVEGAIVFDIPKDQTPTSAELHDSAFSDGIKVNLK